MRSEVEGAARATGGHRSPPKRHGSFRRAVPFHVVGSRVSWLRERSCEPEATATRRYHDHSPVSPSLVVPHATPQSHKARNSIQSAHTEAIAVIVQQSSAVVLPPSST